MMMMMRTIQAILTPTTPNYISTKPHRAEYISNTTTAVSNVWVAGEVGKFPLDEYFVGD